MRSYIGKNLFLLFVMAVLLCMIKMGHEQVMQSPVEKEVVK